LSNKISQLGTTFELLPEVLDGFEKDLELVPNIVAIEGKLLERANVEQAAQQLYYDTKRRELRTILKYVELRKDKVYGQLFKAYTETHSRELSDRGKEKYINNEQEYLTIQEIYLEVEELYEKYDAVIEAFKMRGYALNNITKIRVSSLENTQL